MSRKTVIWRKRYRQGLQARGKEGAWNGLFPDRRARSTGSCCVKKETEAGIILQPGIASGVICSEAMEPAKMQRIRKLVGG